VLQAMWHDDDAGALCKVSELTAIMTPQPRWASIGGLAWCTCRRCWPRCSLSSCDDDAFHDEGITNDDPVLSLLMRIR
jgi:hypothetical protein